MAFDPHTGQLDLDDLRRLLSNNTAAVFVENPSYLGILAKLAYAQGLEILTILTWRFAAAATLLGGFLALTRPRVLFPSRRQLLTWLGLGAVGYAVQANLFFSGLRRIPASVASVLLYIYPVLVALLAWAVNRKPPLRREWLAMVVALAGVVLTVGAVSPAGSSHPALDPLGVGFALASAMWYAGYILVSGRALRGSGTWVPTAWVLLGAFFTFALISAPRGMWRLSLTPGQAAVLLAMVIFSTILPIGTFLAGLKRIGPTAASLLGTLEPVFTVVLAWLVLREGLSPAQVLGGGLVLLAVVLLYLPGRSAP
ncbi:MAG: DMT family transporter [Chloroflexota bacterium]